MNRPVWLYVYDPDFLDELAAVYAVASSSHHVRTLPLPLDRRRDVRPGDRVAVWVRPSSRSVYRPGLWGVGIVARQTDGDSDYVDRDRRDRRRKCWCVDVRLRCAEIVDARDFGAVDAPWRQAEPLAPVGLVDDVLADFRGVCRDRGLPAVMLALLGEERPSSAASTPPEWADLPEPIHAGLRLERLQWVSTQLVLPPAVVVEIRRRRGAPATNRAVEKALRLEAGTVERLAALEAEAARRFPQVMDDPAPPRPRPARASAVRPSPAQSSAVRPRPVQPSAVRPRPVQPALRRGPRARPVNGSRGGLPSDSALCPACGLLPNPMNGRCGCV